MDRQTRLLSIFAVVLGLVALIVSIHSHVRVSSITPPPPPSGQKLGATPGTLVPPPPSTGGPYQLESTAGLMTWPDAGGGGSGDQWQTAFNCNLTTQPSQTFSTNTTYSLCGYTNAWTFENVANVHLTPWAVVNGTGLNASCESTSGPGTGDPMIWILLNTAIPTGFNIHTPIQLTACFTNANYNSTRGGGGYFYYASNDGAAFWSDGTGYLPNIFQGQTFFFYTLNARGGINPNGSNTNYSLSGSGATMCYMRTWTNGLVLGSIASFVQTTLPSSADAWITAGYTTHGDSSYSFDQTVSFTRGNGDNPANWQVGLSVTASDSPVTLTWTSLKLEYQTY